MSQRIKNLIIGGGLVGRIVANSAPGAVILEAREESFNKRPNFSFGTNYLWKDIPEFRTVKVKVTTRIDDVLPTNESILRYKNKVGKGSEKEGEWGLQFKPETEGFMVKAVPYADVRYGTHVSFLDLAKRVVVAADRPYEFDQLHSTIPLPELLLTAGMDKVYPLKTIFKFKPVYVRVVPIPPEAVVRKRDEIYVNYISNPLLEPYRYCDRFSEGERHYESLTPIGFPHKRIYPGKIWGDPCVEDIVNEFKKNGVFCWGRYGAWNPNELLHETYEKVKAWLT